jgi:signal transduction histidine kinase
VAHGGHISLEDVASGACFLIVLPIEGPGENVA